MVFMLKIKPYVNTKRILNWFQSDTKKALCTVRDSRVNKTEQLAEGERSSYFVLN